MRKLSKILILAQFVLLGCITVNMGGSDSGADKSNEKIMLANPDNVYRNSTNVIIRAMVQGKDGKWTDSEVPILIPGGWYIVSGNELEGKD